MRAVAPDEEFVVAGDVKLDSKAYLRGEGGEREGVIALRVAAFVLAFVCTGIVFEYVIKFVVLSEHLDASRWCFEARRRPAVRWV